MLQALIFNKGDGMMKKIFKRVLTVMLTAVMLLTAAPLSGFAGLDLPNLADLFTLKADAATYSGECGSNLTWSLDTDTGVLTISGKGYMYKWSSSSKAPWYSKRSSVKTVVIGDSVTRIGDCAFEDCTSLTSVTIGNSVTSIGYHAFWHCHSLTSITVKEGNPNYSSDEYGVLFNKDKTLLIQYPIGNTRTSYTIPDSVTSIGEDAFYRCTSLTSVTIPDSVTSIGEDAFYRCTSLTSVTIGNSVTSIGNGAFYDCDSLTSVTIGNSVTSIGDKAFYYCAGLTSVTIPDSVTSIGDYAFEFCKSLTSVTIPDSVTSIGNLAFRYCYSLTSVTVKEGNPNYSSDEYGVLFNKDKTLLIQYPIGNTRTSYTIPDSVTSIGNWAFRDCTSLTSVTIPDSVTSIGGGTFYNCTGLTSVTIGNSVTSIGEDVFYNCTRLTSVAIGNSVTSIGIWAFGYCKSLTSVTIGNSVTSIGNLAFEYCTSLTSVTIGNSVTSIGFLAFNGCTGLTSISIPDSVTSFGSNVLSGCTNLISIDIGNGVTKINESEFKNYTNLKSFKIGTGVTTIGAYAFNGCTGLEEMVIPYSVKSIGSAAFTGCTNLGSLTVYSRNCTFADDATAYYTTICGFTGSTAETYANEKGFDFVAIDDTHTHVYDNDCDSICNICGAERTVGEHIFGDYTVTKEPTCTEQGEKARICAICNYKDTEAIPATGHTYNSDCDTDCNVCGAVRVPPHSDNDTNGICDNCGAYLSDIALSTVKDVVVSAGETVYLKFTAPYTGRYTFYSSSSSDTYGYVCDSNKNSLVSDDDSGSNNNFLITTTLTQGTVYYLGVKYYSPSNSGTIPVTINYICDHTSTHTEHKDSTCTEHGYDKSICDICGATVSTTELPYKHDYVATVTAPTCTEQGYTTYTCSLCGDSYTADYTEPLNHPHKTWRVTKNPTADSTGLMIETCDLCGAQFSEMEIPMLIPDFVTGITVSPNRLALDVGETANLTAVITPDTAENKNVIWSSSDTDIATVADGVVTAKTPGVAMIIVQSEDGGYKDFCVVRVASLTPVNGAVVDNENGLIYGIASNSADINSYVNTVDGTMTIECDSALLGTGSVVNIVKDDVIVDSYKIVLFGDVNGDGWYDGMDAVTVSCIANGMLTKDQIGEAAYMAADCNHDGVVDEFDVALLNQAGVLLANVDQTKTQEELAADSDYVEYLNLIDQQNASEDTTEIQPEDETPDFFAKLISIIEYIVKFITDFISKIF